jgi:hypothetical protein
MGAPSAVTTPDAAFRNVANAVSGECIRMAGPSEQNRLDISNDLLVRQHGVAPQEVGALGRVHLVRDDAKHEGMQAMR